MGQPFGFTSLDVGPVIFRDRGKVAEFGIADLKRNLWNSPQKKKKKI